VTQSARTEDDLPYYLQQSTNRHRLSVLYCII